MLASLKTQLLAGWKHPFDHLHTNWRRYAWAILLVVGASILCTILLPVIAPANLEIIYLLAVVLSAYYLGRAPSILASVLSVLVFDYFFIPPYFTLEVDDTQYLITFAGLLLVGLVISQLTAQVRDQARAAIQRGNDTSALYDLSRGLSIANDLNAIAATITINLRQTFGRQSTIFLPEAQSRLTLKPFPTSDPGVPVEKNSMNIILWVMNNGLPAGRGAPTFPSAREQYHPLKTPRGVLGVLVVRPSQPEHQLLPEQTRLLEAFTIQAALAIERYYLAEQARQAQILQAAEKLETALLNSISHDLRTPLVSITGALTSLYETSEILDETARRSLIETARDEAGRLNRLVSNLLSMTRIEAGAIHVAYQPCDVQDLIGTAIEHLHDRLEDRRVTIQLADDLPLIPMDFVLIQQVLVNLLDNAIKYSPPTSPIDILARLTGAYLEIEIADRGPGIPAEDLLRVFKKFYRVQRADLVGGTGLGLSICKGLVAAHDGYIAAENRPGGGSIFTVGLPVPVASKSIIASAEKMPS